ETPRKGIAERQLMVSKRASLNLLVCVFLLIATGFATTKKFQRGRNGSGDRNVLSLQSGNLPDTGSSLSSGGSAFPSSGVLRGGSSSSLSPGTPDNWSDGTG